MFRLFRKPPAESPTPPAPTSQTVISARPEVRGASARGNETKGQATKAGEPIEIRHTVPMRARPEVLYRLALVPTRRAAWDSNMAEAAWIDDAQTLKNGARARFKLVRQLGGLRFEAEYGGLKSSKSGGWRSVGGVGPLEELSQEWQFRAVPNQPVTEVTLTVRGWVRYGWVRPQVERLLQQMLLSTLLEMQRQVDAPTAHRIDEMNEELRRQQEAERKAAKQSRKTPGKKR